MLVPDSALLLTNHAAPGTAGQTLVNCGMSWLYNDNRSPIVISGGMPLRCPNVPSTCRVFRMPAATSRRRTDGQSSTSPSRCRVTAGSRDSSSTRAAGMPRSFPPWSGRPRPDASSPTSSTNRTICRCLRDYSGRSFIDDVHRSVVTSDGAPTTITWTSLLASSTEVINVEVIAQARNGTGWGVWKTAEVWRRRASEPATRVAVLSGSPSPTGSNAGAPPRGWAATLGWNGATNCVEIRVTGVAGATITWSASVTAHQVQ